MLEEDLYYNGTLQIFYYNGTEVEYSYDFATKTKKFVKYLKAPTSFFVGYKDDKIDDGVRRTFDNDTVRIIYDPLTSANTRFENATAAFW